MASVGEVSDHTCALHGRDNYGFVSFNNKDDAYEAVEHGNDDPSYPRVDLCFGGRRKFCKQKYSDLGERLNGHKVVPICSDSEQFHNY